MKEGGGGDHLSVGVRKPGSRRITPVSRGNVYLKPPSKEVILGSIILKILKTAAPFLRPQLFRGKNIVGKIFRHFVQLIFPPVCLSC